MNLTDEQLNIAMCEWVGWRRNLSESDSRGSWFTPAGGSFALSNQLPNYLSDDSPRWLLNEAEAGLTDAQQDKVNDTLWDLMEGKKYLWQASARQRTIAILKTVKPEMFL